jgi:hypothetical protein
MDVTKLAEEVAKDEEGAVVPIFKKDGTPYLAADGTTQVTITVRGSESRAYAAAQASIQRRMLAMRRAKLEPEDLLRNRIDLAASAVIDWSGWESNGAPYPATPENARVVLAAIHILEQVEAGITGHADFFAKRSTG